MSNLSNVLLADIEQLKEESYLDKNVDNRNIRTAMMYVQDYIVDHVTGSCLLDQIKYLICNNKIKCDCYRWYKKLLDEHIFPILTYGIQAELAPHLTLKERNEGIIRNSDQNLQYPVLSEVNYIKGQYSNKLDFYVVRAVKFLKCNRKRFIELCGCGCLCDCETAPFADIPYTSSLSLNATFNNNRNKYRL